MLTFAITILLAAFFFISPVCYIIVLVRMFQNGDGKLGAICIVLTIFCGIGPLLGLIIGWMNAKDYGVETVMLIWTTAILAGIVGVGLGSFAPA
jgi:hypothetical protein